MKLLKLTPFILLSITACSLFVPSSKKLYKKSIIKTSQYDAIIIPGIPFIEPKWDNVMLMRVTWAVHLYKKGLTKNLIMSGSSVYTPYVEAEIMKLYAIELGVPDSNVFVENKAQHSTENLWYGYHLGKKLGFKKIALATDPFQTKMLYRFGRKHTKDVAYLPVIFDTLKSLPHITPTIEYSKYKIENFIPLPEKESWLKRFKGTRGKNIDFKVIPQ